MVKFSDLRVVVAPNRAGVPTASLMYRVAGHDLKLATFASVEAGALVSDALASVTPTVASDEPLPLS